MSGKKSRDSTAPPSAPAAPATSHSGWLARLRHRLELVNEWFEAAGISLHGIPFTLIWWRRIGLRWTIALVLAIGAPVGGYTTLAYTAMRTIPAWVGDFGVRFEARQWDIHLFHLAATARGVTLRRDEHSDPVFTASEVEFQGSLKTLFTGLFTAGGSYNAIRISNGEVRIEQSLNGDWNWNEFLEAVPERRRAHALAGLYEIGDVTFANLRVVYTEHVPGGSGDGVIRTTQATIYIEGGEGYVADLRRRTSAEELPTRFQFSGRSADGVVRLKGRAGIAATEPHGAQTTATVRVSTGGDTRDTAAIVPSFDVNLYLENISFGAYSRMAPTTRLLPDKGTLQGAVDFVRTGAGLDCRGQYSVQNIGFSPNGAMVEPVQYRQAQRDLDRYRSTGTFDPCLRLEATQRADGGGPATLSAVMASLNAQATANAPTSIRAYAALDQAQLAGIAVPAALTDAAARLGGRIGGALGSQMGRDAMQAAVGGAAAPPARPAAPPAASGGNPVSKGVKGIGSGLKRLFGGGDRKRSSGGSR